MSFIVGFRVNSKVLNKCFIGNFTKVNKKNLLRHILTWFKKGKNIENQKINMCIKKKNTWFE